MDTRETIKLYKSDNILLSDSNYYKYIFKKTEKIVCVVFYVIGHADTSQHDTAVASILGSAKRALDSVLQTLSCRWYTASGELHTFLNTLVALESNVRVAQAVGLVQEDIADILSLEIETVLRSLRQYLGYEKSGAPDLLTFSSMEERMPPQAGAPPRAPTGTVRENVRRSDQKPVLTADPVDPRGASGAPAPTARAGPRKGQSREQYKGQHAERRRMIKDILASKRQSTIKDISGQIPVYSEKTVQREIVALLNEGAIIKEGERRWRRYSLAPGV